MKKLIIIDSDIYVRNFLTTGTFEGIIEAGDHFVCEEHVAWPNALESQLAGRFKYCNSETQAHSKLNDVLMVRNSKRSSAFQFRFARYLNKFFQSLERRLKKIRANYAPTEVGKPGRFLRDLFLLAKHDFSTFKAKVEQGADLAIIRIFGFPILAGLYHIYFNWSTKPNSNLEALLSQTSPDLILLPTSAAGPTLTDVLRLRSTYCYKVLLLVDNWDNLSSKTVFTHIPDYLAVWGPQTKEHAWTIHRIPGSKVFQLGTPRFDHYLEVVSKVKVGQPPPSPYPFEYALFTGCAIPFDETSALIALEKICERINERDSRKLKIVFRPHPWRQGRIKEAKFNEKRFKHVLLDLQVKESYLNRPIVVTSFQPDLSYYPPLLANARLVVGPLTTMLLESALFEKQIIALAYDDGIHFTNPKRAYENYPHFQGIDKIPGLSLVHDLEKLAGAFETALEASKTPINESEHTRAMSYFLYRDKQAYGDRLKNLICEIEQQRLWNPSPKTSSFCAVNTKQS